MFNSVEDLTIFDTGKSKVRILRLPKQKIFFNDVIIVLREKKLALKIIPIRYRECCQNFAIKALLNLKISHFKVIFFFYSTHGMSRIYFFCWFSQNSSILCWFFVINCQVKLVGREFRGLLLISIFRFFGSDYADSTAPERLVNFK